MKKLDQMNMLQSTEFVQDKNRINLYFDEYEFKITARILGVHYFRYVLTEEEFHDRCKKKVVDVTAQKNRFSLLQFILWRRRLKSEGKKVKIVITANSVTIYSNDFEILNEFYSLFSKNNTLKLYKAQNTEGYKKGIIYRKSPKKQYRVFLKFKKWEEKEHEEFKNFFKSYQEQIIPSPTTKQWIFSNKRRNIYRHKMLFTYEGMFLDMDDVVYASYITLKFGDIIRRIVKIEKSPV